MKSLQREQIEFNELALLSAQILAENTTAKIDLHTTTFSANINGKKATLVPAFKIKTYRATGAGDAWDAGNILGYANDLNAQDRLTLANAVAACYLSDPEGRHPTKERLIEFLQKATTFSRSA